jgi:hypothetical protein
MSARSLSWNAVALVAVILVMAACNSFETPADDTNQPAAVNRITAYYCATHGVAQCAVRGDPIPSGTLPPTTESFMVWAWTPGTNLTEACIYTDIGNGCSDRQTQTDSVGYYANVTGKAHNYKFVISILGVNDRIVSSDSLIWVYP